MKMKASFAARALLFSLLLMAGIAYGQSLVGKVTKVKDGDSVIVLDDQKREHEIRLAGIDTPESAQPFGRRAKESLSDMVFGKRVEVFGNKIDDYGRTVGKIMVGEVDICLEQIRAGMAWHFKKYQREQSATDRAAYAEAEEKARAGRIGLWRDPAPTPPWNWRRGDKEADNQKMAAQQTTECPCGGAALCTGSRGGQYCMKPNGKKQYQ